MRVVHIGFPKTATKFLQTRVFPALPSSYAYFDGDAAERIFRPVTSHDDTIFDHDELAARLAQACSSAPHALFSYEPLTGLEYRSGFVNRTPIAQRLRKLGFERVIITIRNQFDVLESAYKEYVRNGGVLKVRHYLSFGSTEPRYLYAEYFDYSSIHRLYAEIFGGSNVLVLQHERLHEPSFRADLARFLGVDGWAAYGREAVHRSLSSRKTRLLRVINHYTSNAYHPSHPISNRISTSLFARALGALPFWNGSGSLLDPDLRATIAAFYRESNARLAKDAALALAPEYP
jgi:hypothetical protein